MNHVHILKSVIFQKVLHIVYFKIIPTISQKFDSNFLGPKLAHTINSPFYIKNVVTDGLTMVWAKRHTDVHEWHTLSITLNTKEQYKYEKGGEWFCSYIWSSWGVGVNNIDGFGEFFLFGWGVWGEVRIDEGTCRFGTQHRRFWLRFDGGFYWKGLK